jgi:hypothetical protein
MWTMVASSAPTRPKRYTNNANGSLTQPSAQGSRSITSLGDRERKAVRLLRLTFFASNPPALSGRATLFARYRVSWLRAV